MFADLMLSLSNLFWNAVYIIGGILVLSVIFQIIKAMKNNEIIECGSCGNRMTKGNHSDRGGCPRCGSDIVVRTGTGYSE